MESKSVLQRRQWAINRILNCDANRNRNYRFPLMINYHTCITDGHELYFLKQEIADQEYAANGYSDYVTHFFTDIDRIIGGSTTEFQIDPVALKVSNNQNRHVVNIQGHHFAPKLIKNMIDIMGEDAWFSIGKPNETSTTYMLACSNDVGKCVVFPYRYVESNAPLPNVTGEVRSKPAMVWKTNLQIMNECYNENLSVEDRALTMLINDIKYAESDLDEGHYIKSFHATKAWLLEEKESILK